MSGERIRIGSRVSKLALFQANLVKSLLYKHYPDLRIDIDVIKTKGDIILETPLAKIGDKGLFTKEIENALLAGKIDMAVHSMKDLPTVLPDGLTIGAILEREDPRDAFVSFKYAHFADLPEAAVIATSSLRRRANIKILRPDIRLTDVRGNVDTRLRKLRENDYDGMILAAAGLRRLGFSDVIREIIDPDTMLPAVAQGALGVEIRADDGDMKELLTFLHDEATAAEVYAERAFLRRLEGGCQIPIGALARVQDGHLLLTGMVADLDGIQHFKGKLAGPIKEPEAIGQKLADQLRDQGADEILEKIFREQRSI